MSQIRNLQAATRPQAQMGYPLPAPKTKLKRHRVNEWDENFTQSNIPDYRVYQDKFAQGYISILKKNKKFKQYLNVIMKPGGIRALRKPPSDGMRAESTYSDGSPSKSRMNGPSGGSQAPINRNNMPKGSIGSSASKKLRGAISQNRKDNQQDHEPSEEQVQSFKSELDKAWTQNQVPIHHKNKFMDNLQLLDSRVMCSIIAKELEDFSVDHAPIQRVLKAVVAREECLRQIESYSQDQLKNHGDQRQIDSGPSTGAANLQVLIDQVAKYLINLRYLSVHVVESIVLWRDQLRYIAILSQGNRQKLKKQQAPPALQVPFIGSDNINYMIKMKTDTSHFGALEISKYFNFCDASRSDPFLITASLQQRNHAAGSGVRAIKHGKAPHNDKLILPLQEQLINKAKACEEVILFERGELRCNPSSQSMRFNMGSPSNASLANLQSNHGFAEKQTDGKITSAPQANSGLQNDLTTSKKDNEQLKAQEFGQTQEQKLQQASSVQPAAQAQLHEETPNPDDVTFVLEPLNLKESEFEKFFELYLKQVDTRIVNSYHDLDQIIEKQNAGYERHYVKLTHRNETKGVAIFNIDPTASNEQRCYIRHVSTTDLRDITKALQQVVDFIWRRIQCSNIRVEIFHLKEEGTGKFQADPDVKNAYTKCGFKWKTLANDPVTGKRAQIMQANKPATAAQFENIRHLDLGKEPVTIKAGMIMGLGAGDQRLSHQPANNKKCEIISCLLSGLKQIKETSQATTGYAEQNSQAPVILKKYLEIVDRLPKESQFAAARTTSCAGADEAYASIASQGLQVQLANQHSQYLSSVLSLVARLPAFDFALVNGFYYLRIRSKSILRVKHIDHMSRKQVGSDIAIIPTDDERLKIVIIPNDVLSKDSDKEGVASEVQRVLKNCEVSEQKVTEVWLPSFKISHQVENLAVKGLKMSNGNTVQESQECATIEICKGDYQKEGLSFEPSSDSSLVIKTSFVFALSDAELEESIDNLPLIACRVDEKDWIKKL